MSVFNPLRMSFRKRRRRGCGACVVPFCPACSNAFPTASKKHFQSNPTTDNPTIRHPTTRQPTSHKEQQKPINPKQGKAKTGPPSHGGTAMARASRMPRCRSTCPRNAKTSNRLAPHKPQNPRACAKENIYGASKARHRVENRVRCVLR